MDPQIIDGFTHSLSQLLLPISYRASALAQMEVLRLAGAFQFRAYTVPSPENPSPGGGADNNPANYIAAYSQREQQVSMPVGTYIYGWMFYCSAGNFFHIQITDACTETPMASDYILATLFTPSASGFTRGPFLLSQPRLISSPGLVNVEIYNNNSSAQKAQLVLYCAAPLPIPPPDIPTSTGYHPEATQRGPLY